MKKIPDNRYTLAREYCGYATARHVARFCGDWIGQSETRAGAVDLARAHRAKFLWNWRGSFAIVKARLTGAAPVE